MFIAHLPAGYITAKLLIPKLADTRIKPHQLVLTGMIGAIAPDLDMLYFYLVDNRQHNHHTYWSHYPIVWLGLLLVSSAWFKQTTDKSRAILTLIFSVGGFIHMLLDSVAADIWWFAPLYNEPYSMQNIQAFYKPWWLNFIFHWSFGLEILICFISLFLRQRGRKQVA